MLNNFLKLFYDATTILSGRNYPTLAISKFVQNALFKYFDKFNEGAATAKTQSQQKLLDIENEIGKALLQNINAYFNDKTTAKEKTIMLVSFLLF